MIIMICSPYIHHDLLPMYVHHNHFTLDIQLYTLHVYDEQLTMYIFTMITFVHHACLTLQLHHILTMCLPQCFTICSLSVFHNYYTICSPCMFIRIPSLNAHIYNNHFTITSPHIQYVCLS